MARNEEKAQSILSRFRQQKELELTGGVERRPYLASECTNLHECEKWRREIIREVGKGVSSIQNGGLGEYRIRDLNDEINKLLREKRHWEKQIKKLGGPDYARAGDKMLDKSGKSLPGDRSYKYFGAAKDLPGVRELLQPEEVQAPRRTRGDMFKHVDADYYGYRDEEDGVLVALEAEAEQQAVAQAVMDWKQRVDAGEFAGAAPSTDTDRYHVADEPLPDDHAAAAPAPGAAGGEAQAEEVLAVPSQEEIEQMLLRRRKEVLMSKYASQELVAESEATRTLTGRR